MTYLVVFHKPQAPQISLSAKIWYLRNIQERISHGNKGPLYISLLSMSEYLYETQTFSFHLQLFWLQFKNSDANQKKIQQGNPSPCFLSLDITNPASPTGEEQREFHSNLEQFKRETYQINQHILLALGSKKIARVSYFSYRLFLYDQGIDSSFYKTWLLVETVAAVT